MLLQKITSNFTGVTRYDTMEGRDYLVAPMIMMVAGVHDGSNGPLLYPADEMSKTPAVWNYKPVIVYHPQANGEIVSACDPDILTNRKIGVIMNTTFVDGKLKAEAWLEVDRMKKVDERIIQAIEEKQVMELSTGLFTDNDTEEGEWNGEAYDGTARNYRPDHLALLPDIKGACSIEDGAGFLRLNEEKKTIELSIPIKRKIKDKKRLGNILNRKVQEVITNETSFEDIRQRLQSILREKFEEDEYLYIEDVFDDYFVYEKAGNFHKQVYKDVDGTITFVGIPIMVVKDIRYLVKNDTNFNRKGNKMDKKQTVEDLIKNEVTLWKDEDKDTLMELEENVLEKMVPVENQEEDTTQANEAAAAAAAAAAANDDGKDKDDEEASASVENMTAEEYIDKNVPVAMKGVLRSGLASYNASKAKLVEVITANEKNRFTKEQLESKELDELSSLAALAAHTEKQQEEVSALNYAGQLDATHNETEEEPLDVPVMNFAK